MICPLCNDDCDRDETAFLRHWWTCHLSSESQDRWRVARYPGVRLHECRDASKSGAAYFSIDEFVKHCNVYGGAVHVFNHLMGEDK